MKNLAGRAHSTKLGKLEKVLNPSPDIEVDNTESTPVTPAGTLRDYMGPAKLTESQKVHIEWVMFRMFICCALPWALLNSEYFIAFVLVLCPAFIIPDRSSFFPKHLAQEVAAWGEAFKKFLENYHHLTLSLDGWSTRACDELYTFHMTTPKHRSFFTDGHVFKGVSVTGEALLGVIVKVFRSPSCLHQYTTY